MLTARLDFAGLHVLDLYAGSGALGLEAASRGAASVTLVESDRRAAELIRRNVAALGLSDATVLARPVAAVLGHQPDRPVDLVLADPPYEAAREDVESVLAALAERGWVRPAAVVVVERRAAGAPLRWPAGWQPWPTRQWGDTRAEIAECG